MAAKPIKFLELQYTMTQFLINCVIFLSSANHKQSYLGWSFYTPVGLIITPVSLTITQVSLLGCLRLTLNSGNLGMIHTKCLQTAVCILLLVCNLHLTLSLYVTPRSAGYNICSPPSSFYTHRYEKMRETQTMDFTEMLVGYCAVSMLQYSYYIVNRPGDTPRKIRWECAARLPKPLPYLWQKSALFSTLFMTSPQIWNPIYDLSLTSKSCLRRAW